MKHGTMLTIASLLTIVFLIYHMTDDFLREGGLAVRGINNLVVIPVLARGPLLRGVDGDDVAAVLEADHAPPAVAVLDLPAQEVAAPHERRHLGGRRGL